MKKIRNIFLAFMLGIASQSSAFDVCAGDFFEEYEKKFQKVKKDLHCRGFLDKNRQNKIQNAMKTNNTAKKLQAVVDVGIALEYKLAINTYEQMLEVCSPNIQKLKARKAYFDMTVRRFIVYSISFCEGFCLRLYDKSFCK